jgi:predicted RNA-binding protein YlqC (UPF0109 family)
MTDDAEGAAGADDDLEDEYGDADDDVEEADDIVDEDVEDDGNDDDDDDEVDDEDGGDDVNRIPAGTARAVLEYLARAVVDDPDSVQVDTREGRGRGIGLAVQVAPGDMGRVIGKRGRTAQAIRTVTRAAAVRDDVEVNIEFME